MKIIEIQKTGDENHFVSFRIREEGCGCCEEEHTCDGLTIEDLNQYANWLQEQMAYESIIRKSLNHR